MLFITFLLYVPMLRYRLYFVGLYLCALLYIAAGINHFVNAEMYLRTMPPYLPAHEVLVALSGVIEIVLGVALVLRPKTRLSACVGCVGDCPPAHRRLPCKYPDLSQYEGRGGSPSDLRLGASATPAPSYRLGLGLYAPDASAP